MRLDGFPRVRLATLPTPVEPLDLREVVPAFSGRAWVKREDRTGAELGGNKVRKLEFLLGDALEREARTVVAVGGIGSNHLLSTTFYATERGLEPHLAIFPHHASEASSRTLRAICALGPHIVVARGPNTVAVTALRRWVRLRATGRRPYLMLPGGSSPTGVLGAVGAGLEIADQIAGGELDAPDALYCAYGSGGTAAGVAVGLALASYAPEIKAVRVYPSPATSAFWLEWLGRAAARRLGSDGVDFSRLHVVDGYLGEGYAEPTESAGAASEAAAELGLTLEPTYTAKAFAAFLDAAGSTLREANLLFLCTYDPRVPQGLAHVSEAMIPERLRTIAC